jgi:hypothetical protein
MRNKKPEVNSKCVWRMARKQDSGFVLKKRRRFFCHLVITFFSNTNAQTNLDGGDDFVATSIRTVRQVRIPIKKTSTGLKLNKISEGK